MSKLSLQLSLRTRSMLSAKTRDVAFSVEFVTLG